MDVHYTGPTDEGRYWVSVDLGEGVEDPLEFERGAMVRMICRTAVLHEETQIRIFVNGSKEPIQIPGPVVKRIVSKELSPEDLLIGGTPRYLWFSPSASFPLREVYGDENYECPACGAHACLGTTHLRCRCEAVLPIQIRPAGIFVNLVEALRQNPKQERWFINRPWNPNRPWMSRDRIKLALGLSKEQ